MKLGTWIDGNMDIMHVISFCSYVKIVVAMATKNNNLKMVEFLTMVELVGYHIA
jgi:hypothetical protein